MVEPFLAPSLKNIRKALPATAIARHIVYLGENEYFLRQQFGDIKGAVAGSNVHVEA
jgi:hypothetical protein